MNKLEVRTIAMR